ncbi:hypothetical protein FACS1894184_18530 [Clostridia bacterium]|nr:hypothetical protein FACS1894184_18530 [Clostridia bacterium]
MQKRNAVGASPAIDAQKVSAADTQKVSKPKPLVQPRLWVALFGVITVVMAGSLFRVTRLFQSTTAQADKLQAELDLENAEKARLTRERDYMASLTYIERAARIEYGYIYPNDIRFVAATATTDDSVDDDEYLYDADED